MVDQGRKSNLLFTIFCSSQFQINPFTLYLIWPGIMGFLLVCLFLLAAKISNIEFPSSKFIISEG